MPAILEAVTDDQLRTLQDGLRLVWRRFMYTSNPFYRSEANKLVALAAKKRAKIMDINGSLPVAHLSPQHNTADLFEDDALSTILGFLYQKIYKQGRV